MVSLDKLRIAKLKCLSCGCRDKRIAFLRDKITRKRVGITTICCNCGETKTYIFRNQEKGFSEETIKNMDVKSYLEGNVYVEGILCAIPEPFCPNKNCPLYKTRCQKEFTYEEFMTGKYDGELIRCPETIPDSNNEKGKFI